MSKLAQPRTELTFDNVPSLTRKRAGFTLVELLIVVAILGILMGLLSGGILSSMKNAKRQRREAERKSLESAITDYWHDYNHWPHKEGEEQSKGGGSNELRIYKEKNWKVFNKLSGQNAVDNPLKKRYIDESVMMTTTGSEGEGQRISLYKKRGDALPSISDPSTIVDYEGNPYKVTFNLEINTVKVE